MNNMTIEDIEVPEEMFRVIYRAWLSDPGQWTEPRLKHAVALGLLHLSNNPIVPTVNECSDISASVRQHRCADISSVRCYIEWQRRMFLKREPGITLSGDWPSSTCVECGEKMPSGQTRRCPSGGEMGTGFCTHHVPAAIRKALDLGRSEAKGE